MAGAAQTVSVVAHSLPALEPILGITIAINLAYLNLDKFQYISIVRDRLRSRLGKLDDNVKESVKNTEWYCQLEDLASVDTLDLEWPKFTKKIWIKAPGIWGALYNIFFYWRFGRILSITATAYALVLLILGAGYASGAIEFWAGYFDQHIGRHFVWSSLAALWPILTVVVGEGVCISAARFVRYQTNNLQERARNEAEETVAQLEQALGANPLNAVPPAQANPAPAAE